MSGFCSDFPDRGPVLFSYWFWPSAFLPIPTSQFSLLYNNPHSQFPALSSPVRSRALSLNFCKVLFSYILLSPPTHLSLTFIFMEIHLILPARLKEDCIIPFWIPISASKHSALGFLGLHKYLCLTNIKYGDCYGRILSPKREILKS